MTYVIEYADSFDPHSIRSIPAKQKGIIERSIYEKLTIAPESFGKPLRYALKGQRRLRVGDYRVIYVIQKRTVIILDINHRSKIY